MDEAVPQADKSKDEKGKGREPADKIGVIEEDYHDVVEPSSKEVLAGFDTIPRLTSSAMALGNSLLSKPKPAGQFSSSDKAGSASNTRVHSAMGETSISKKSGSNTDLGSTIRASHAQAHVQREEEAFSQFLDGIDGSLSHNLDSGDHIIDELQSNVPLSALGSTRSVQPDQYSDLDGQEVVKLLDNSYDEVWQADREPSCTREEEASLRRALFDSGDKSSRSSQESSDWANLLNFVPEYISNESSGWGHHELVQHLGTLDVQEASRIWAEQWGDVLSRYTDEVWGSLGSLVQKAKEEARTIQESGGKAEPSEATAILRLQQILAHIRGS